jgi:hypothetical protein
MESLTRGTDSRVAVSVMCRRTESDAVALPRSVNFHACFSDDQTALLRQSSNLLMFRRWHVRSASSLKDDDCASSV